jgi:hypothetical protein
VVSAWNVLIEVLHSLRLLCSASTPRCCASWRTAAKLTAAEIEDAAAGFALSGSRQLRFGTRVHETYAAGKEDLPRQVLAVRPDVYLHDDVWNFGNFQFAGTPANGITVGKMVQSFKQRVQIGNRI